MSRSRSPARAGRSDGHCFRSEAEPGTLLKELRKLGIPGVQDLHLVEVAQILGGRGLQQPWQMEMLSLELIDMISPPATALAQNLLIRKIAASLRDTRLSQNSSSSVHERLTDLENKVMQLQAAHLVTCDELNALKARHAPVSSSEVASSSKAEEIRSGSLTLKVGSRRFQTTVETLHRIPDTYFASLVSGRWSVDRDKDGNMLIDRNPKHFQKVLDYLCDGGANFVPPESKVAQDELRVEAMFYGLVDLAASLRRLRVASNHMLTMTKKGAKMSGNKYAAAVLDVRDPNDWIVTFKFDCQNRPSDYIIGIAPETNLGSEWFTIATPRPSSLPRRARGIDYMRSCDLFMTNAAAPPEFSKIPPEPIELPPAVRHGIFLVQTSQKLKDSLAECYTEFGQSYLTGDGRVVDHDWNRWNKPGWEAATWVRLHFLRSIDGCTIGFAFGTEGRSRSCNHDMNVQIDLGKAGLDVHGEFRPVIFFNNSGVAATIEELQ